MGDELSGEPDAEETKAWVESHLHELEDVADRTVEAEGYSYRSEADVEVSYFPDKLYGDVFFPQGEYEALKIRLGQARGHNWWCVLYPQFCFIDSACVATPEESLQRLKEAVGEEDWLALQNERPKLQIRFLLFSRHSSDTP